MKNTTLDKINTFNTLIKKPIILSILLFLVSNLIAGIFYVIHMLFSSIIYLPLSFFDSSIICLFGVIYTFKFKEKFLSLNIFKIAVCFTIFVFIRRVIIEFFLYNPNVPDLFLMIRYVVYTILEPIFYLFFVYTGLKLINIASLKLLDKINNNKIN